MISFQHVTRNFEDTVALSSVSLEVKAGQIIGLLGLNGAGKTTLMRILTGTLSPSSGSVRIGPAGDPPESLQAKAQIGYLPEHCPLYDDMLVQDYLVLIAGLRGLPPKTHSKSIRETARRLGLMEHLCHPIHTLSKGYRQRVGLAQALIHGPQVAVLDEPTSGLDPHQMEEIRSLIRELAAETTIILSTHNLHEVEGLCDRAIVLVQGRVGADINLNALRSEGGSLAELFQKAHQPKDGAS